MVRILAFVSKRKTEAINAIGSKNTRLLVKRMDERVKTLEKQVQILHTCLRCVINELSDNELIDIETLKHNTKEILDFPIPLQQLK